MMSKKTLKEQTETYILGKGSKIPATPIPALACIYEESLKILNIMKEKNINSPDIQNAANLIATIADQQLAIIIHKKPTTINS